jgi:hypothetical protein
MVLEARKKGRQGNEHPAMDPAEHAGKNARGNIPELPNTTSMVGICCVLNGKNNQTSSNQLQASYTDATHWEELIDSIEKVVPRNNYTV